jgi:hypothetical protein
MERGRPARFSRPGPVEAGGTPALHMGKELNYFA